MVVTLWLLITSSLFIYYSLQEGKRQQFQELIKLMKELLDRRRQILSKTLPRVSALDQQGMVSLFVSTKPMLVSSFWNASLFTVLGVVFDGTGHGCYFVM